MAYTIPPKSNIPFNFGAGGYQAPDFNNISLNFTNVIQSQMADLHAAVNVMQTYQQTTYTFLRYCERYIVGYGQHGVQIIKGRCYYGGIRDIGAVIGAHQPRDLPSSVKGLFAVDLPAYVEVLVEKGTGDLPAVIGTHPPVDLGSIIGGHLPGNLSAYIRGFAFEDLSAYLKGLVKEGLPASILPVPPEDLPAYLRIWPQEDLPAAVHGWDYKDLSGYLNTIAWQNLPAAIGTHRPRNLQALIRGWGREVPADLPAFIHGWDIDGLGAYIRGTLKAELPAYLLPIQPRNLSAFIYGWDTLDLGAVITVQQYPWNLPASINITGDYNDLPATIDGKKAVTLPTDLWAYIHPMRGKIDLPAAIGVRYARDLGAFIDPGKDISNLPARIYPKRLRLTGILNVITMAHSDLSATISLPCFYSDLRYLSAYIRPVFKADLSALIHPIDPNLGTSDLSASIGYALNTLVQDKIKINLNIAPLGHRTEDKLTINFRIFRSGLSLGATITGERAPANLSAYINAVTISPYEFDSWKFKERVYETTYTQELVDWQDVYISFLSTVKDYYYSSYSDVVAKVDRTSHFVTKVASYFSPNKSGLLNKKLHKVRYLYDMTSYESTDESIRDAIVYVTSTPISELGAYINAIRPLGSAELSARIGGTKWISENNNLTSYINGEDAYKFDVVLSYTDDGVGYLQF